MYPITQTAGPDRNATNDHVRDFVAVKFGIPYDTKDDYHYNIMIRILQKNLVLCPGIFFITSPLVIKKLVKLCLVLGWQLLLPQEWFSVY
jgi:hypothetical protein